MPATITALNIYPTNDLCRGMCFVGTDIFLASPAPLLEQMDQATGAILADHATGTSGLTWWDTFDPVSNSIWMPGRSGAKVAKFTAAGVLVSNYAVGNTPFAVCVAGANIWVANVADGTLTKLLAATGATIGTYAVGVNPSDNTGVLIFEGSSIWVILSNGIASSLVQVNEGTGAVIQTVALGFRPAGMVLAAGFLWITDFLNNLIFKYDLTGAQLASYATGGAGNPGPVAFDGVYLWVINFGDSSISVLDQAGALLANAIPGPGNLQALAWDGAAYMWLTAGTPFRAVQMFFTPAAGGAGVFNATHTGFIKAGHFGGGNK